MMDTLGAKNVLGYARRFGFEEDFPPYLPIALGAGDATLLEVTSAYTVFPNQGVRMKPFYVLRVMDRDGNLLEENRAEPVDVIRADTAYMMTNLLKGVLVRGTGQRAAGLASELQAAQLRELQRGFDLYAEAGEFRSAQVHTKLDVETIRSLFNDLIAKLTDLEDESERLHTITIAFHPAIEKAEEN